MHDAQCLFSRCAHAFRMRGGFSFFFFFIFTRGTPRIIAVRCPILVGSWPWNEYRFKPWPFMKRNFSFFFFPPARWLCLLFSFSISLYFASLFFVCYSFFISCVISRIVFFFFFFHTRILIFWGRGKREHWFHSFIHKMILYKRSKFVQVEFQVEYRNLLLKYCVTLSLYDIPRY